MPIPVRQFLDKLEAGMKLAKKKKLILSWKCVYTQMQLTRLKNERAEALYHQALSRGLLVAWSSEHFQAEAISLPRDPFDDDILK